MDYTRKSSILNLMEFMMLIGHKTHMIGDLH